MGRKNGLQSRDGRKSQGWQRSQGFTQEMCNRTGAAWPSLACSGQADQEILKLLKLPWVAFKGHLSTHNAKLTKVVERLRKMLPALDCFLIPVIPCLGVTGWPWTNQLSYEMELLIILVPSHFGWVDGIMHTFSTVPNCKN